MHRDDRGVFTELFRQQWKLGVEPIQWNCVLSDPGVLRGVHVHLRHADYLVLAKGKASVGLCDLRPGSATYGLGALVEMTGESLAGLVIPPGVAHGFYFHEPAMHIYAVSHYWDLSDELGCHWKDPDLSIPWPMSHAKISPRDAQLPSLRQLLRTLGETKAA
jgi:dTDP-4-dehydrorhamnose 3,5-epimerase